MDLGERGMPRHQEKGRKFVRVSLDLLHLGCLTMAHYQMAHLVGSTEPQPIAWRRTHDDDDRPQRLLADPERIGVSPLDLKWDRKHEHA